MRLSRRIAALSACVIALAMALAACGPSSAIDPAPTVTSVARRPAPEPTAGPATLPPATKPVAAIAPTPAATAPPASPAAPLPPATEPVAARPSAPPAPAAPDASVPPHPVDAIPTIVAPTTWLPQERIVARIAVPGPVRSIAVGEEGVWVLVMTGSDQTTVVQLDAGTNQISGAPVPLPFEGFQLVVGEGAVWVAGNGGETLARIDPTTRELRLIKVLPGNFVGVGAGAVWLANTGIRDTVQKIDPTAGRVRATLRVGPNPYGIAVGAGSLWVPKHDDVTLSRIDLAGKRVTAEIPLPFAAHGITFGAGTIWVVDYHGLALWPIDPASNQVGAAIPLGFLPAFAAADEQGVWVPAFDEDDTPIREDWITRIDPYTHKERESLRLGEPVGPLALGAGSVWIGLQNGAVLRIKP